MGGIARRLLYFLWFYCDMCVVAWLLNALLGELLLVEPAGWRNVVFLLLTLALTAAVVYPVFKRMGTGPAWQWAAGLLAGGGYLFCLWALFDCRPQMWLIGLAPAIAGAYVTVWKLKE